MLRFGGEYLYWHKDEELEELSEEEEVNTDEPVVTNTADQSNINPEADEQTCMVDVLDTAGQEEYSGMRDEYTKTGDGFLIVYNVTERATFDEALQIHKWILTMTSQDHVYAVLCGNKTDLSSLREVSTVEGVEAASKAGIRFIETSAKTGNNVPEAFHQLVRLIPRRPSNEYKLVILGAGAVGKSSITLRFMNDVFMEDYDPTIEDSFRKMVNISGLPKLDTTTETDAPTKAGVGCECTETLAGAEGGAAKQHVKFTPLSSNQPGNDELGASGHQSDTPKKPKRKLTTQKADSNVLVLTLGELTEPLVPMTGDPIFCKQCSASICDTSQVTKTDKETVWKCTFCSCANKLGGTDINELPNNSVVDYVLSPSGATSAECDDNGTVIYCIDVSGSMAARTRLPDLQTAWKAVRTEEGVASAAKTHISRLKCVQGAICRQLERLQVELPTKAVALVTFSTETKVFGDCSGVTTTLEGDKLQNYEELLKRGQDLARQAKLRPISESYSDLVRRVEGLTECASTALGPALTVCAGLASAHPSSEIVLCTDGQPNTGIGSLMQGNAHNPDFYPKVGQYAREKECKISIIAITGQEVNMQHISKCAKLTSGSVDILHPVELMRQIRLISQNRVIVKDVDVQLIMPSTVTCDVETEQEIVNRVKMAIGNVTEKSDVTFKLKFTKEYMFDSTHNLPFQVQIRFTNSDGAKCLRVINAKQGVTDDRNIMQQNINIAVIGLVAVQTSGQMAVTGDYRNAYGHLLAVKKLIKQAAKSHEQLEEKYIFMNECREYQAKLALHLDKDADTIPTDATVGIFHQQLNCQSHFNHFANVTEKKNYLMRRKAAEGVASQYYQQRF